MTPSQTAWLLAAAVLGGALNAIVGGGSFVTFPALLLAGIPAVMANATSTVALWPAVVASSLAYRKDLIAAKPRPALVIALVCAALGGGVAGSLLLLHTRESTFVQLVPWLLLVAATLFSFGPMVAKRIPPGAGGGMGRIIGGALGIFVISIYGGYFGGGMGILILALLTILGMGNQMHAMNGLRSVLAVTINGVAIVLFIMHHVIAWKPGLMMVVAATTAGYLGAAITRRFAARHVRIVVMSIAWIMTGYFFVRSYWK